MSSSYYHSVPIPVSVSVPVSASIPISVPAPAPAPVPVPVPIETESDLYNHVQLDQNLDQINLINLINLDYSDQSNTAHFNQLNPNPFQSQFSSLDSLDYPNHQSDLNPIQNDDLNLFNNLDYSLESDNTINNLNNSTSTSSFSPSRPPSSSPLDQVLFPPLSHQLPQSSPLFPFDLTPNWQDSINISNKEPELNLNHLLASLDSRFEDWGLILDSIQPNQESNCNYEFAQLVHSSSSHEDEPFQQPSLPVLQEVPCRPITEPLKEFNRSIIQSEALESGLYSINSDPIDLTMPLSPNYYNHSLSMKRKQSNNSAIGEPGLIPFDSLGIRFINSPVDHQEQANEENMDLETAENKTRKKRLKTSANRSTSKSKTHVCTECGKTFPRSTSLSQHKMTHNGERPFRCDFEGCTKSFTTSSNSKRHWRTHFSLT